MSGFDLDNTIKPSGHHLPPVRVNFNRSHIPTMGSKFLNSYACDWYRRTYGVDLTTMKINKKGTNKQASKQTNKQTNQWISRTSANIPNLHEKGMKFWWLKFQIIKKELTSINPFDPAEIAKNGDDSPLPSMAQLNTGPQSGFNVSTGSWSSTSQTWRYEHAIRTNKKKDRKRI